MSIPSRSRKKPKIDVVPLIDVLMVLIIFFLVTMQFRDLRALNIKLPKIDTAGSNLMSNELIVSISQEGDFFINSKKVDFDKLSQALEATALLPRKPVILVVADENVPLRHVTQVVDLCRKSGLEDFRLQAR
ncbi:MAG: biopolymer transporter ExbD [Opitutales bacterium]|nr:biopolymer transporter ExbD [Opitutales bacterium]